MNSKKHILLIVSAVIIFFSCGNETLPKPKAMLRLSYPSTEYHKMISDCPYTFEKNDLAVIEQAKNAKPCWYNLNYPRLKATIYVSYYPIQDNLQSLLRDAQNITQEHVVKADEIVKEIFENKDRKIYGQLSEVSGNAASPTQFYMTDSINHFISGSVYFKVKPNYDSIQPAANYLYNDIIHIMETLAWKK